MAACACGQACARARSITVCLQVRIYFYLISLLVASLDSWFVMVAHKACFTWFAFVIKLFRHFKHYFSMLQLTITVLIMFALLV